MDIFGKKLFSKTAQYTLSQFNQIDEIKHIEKLSSDSEVLRKALDFFVEKNYPHLMAIEE